MCRPSAVSADRPAASDGGLVVSHTRHLVIDRVPPLRCTSAFWQVRHGAGDPAAARRFTRPSRPRPAASDGGGGGDSPARRPGANGRCAPPYPPAVLGVPLLTMLIVRRRRWGPVISWERSRVRLMIAPPPSRPRRRSNSDHARKSLYSGEIDYQFPTFQTGSRI